MSFKFGLGTIREAIRYFHPPKKLQARLPLLPLKWSSKRNPWGDIPQDHHELIHKMLVVGVVRTPHDGYRAIKANPGLPGEKLIKQLKRRRRNRAFRRFWKRIQKIW